MDRFSVKLYLRIFRVTGNTLSPEFNFHYFSIAEDLFH